LAGRDTHNVVVGDHIPRPAGSSARSTPIEERRRDQSGAASVVDVAARRVVVVFEDHTFTFAVLTPTERWSSTAGPTHGSVAAITAPFPGVVAEVHVASGDRVERGQTVAVIEAMKMLHPLVAPGARTVAAVRVVVGDSIAAHETLIEFHPGKGEA